MDRDFVRDPEYFFYVTWCKHTKTEDAVVQYSDLHVSRACVAHDWRRRGWVGLEPHIWDWEVKSQSLDYTWSSYHVCRLLPMSLHRHFQQLKTSRRLDCKPLTSKAERAFQIMKSKTGLKTIFSSYSPSLCVCVCALNWNSVDIYHIFGRWFMTVIHCDRDLVDHFCLLLPYR